MTLCYSLLRTTHYPQSPIMTLFRRINDSEPSTFRDDEQMAEVEADLAQLKQQHGR